MTNNNEPKYYYLKHQTSLFQWIVLFTCLSLFDHALAGDFSLDPLTGSVSVELDMSVEGADIQKYSDFDSIPYNDFRFDKSSEIVINFGAVEVGYPYGPTWRIRSAFSA